MPPWWWSAPQVEHKLLKEADGVKLTGVIFKNAAIKSLSVHKIRFGKVQNISETVGKASSYWLWTLFLVTKTWCNLKIIVLIWNSIFYLKNLKKRLTCVCLIAPVMKQKDKNSHSDRWRGKRFILKVDFTKQNLGLKNKCHYIYIHKIYIIALLNILNESIARPIFPILFVKRSDPCSHCPITL